MCPCSRQERGARQGQGGCPESLRRVGGGVKTQSEPVPNGGLLLACGPAHLHSRAKGIAYPRLPTLGL